jgi:hypothetical protein
MHSNLNRIERARQSISIKILEPCHRVVIVGEITGSPRVRDWTPRAELRLWISRKIRQWPAELMLILRAALAAKWGDHTRCNRTLDAVLLHEEKTLG